MTNPNTKNGITKDSTLVINVPPYLPTNYTQILNHVGFWKWNPTLSQFDEGSQNDYNLLVQPLWFDAESGLPQKIRINSSDTKRLKLENENQDRSSEVVEYVEPSQNNLMVRFNTKTRSITEYPYFEVEGIPPTITNPVTSNGYYKFDGNTLINGTNQDYNLNVQVSSTPKINLERLVFTGSNGVLFNLLIKDSSTYKHKYTTSDTFNLQGTVGAFSIREFSTYYQMRVYLADNANTLKVWVTANSSNPTYYWYYGSAYSVLNIKVNNSSGTVFQFSRNDASQYVSSLMTIYKSDYSIVLE
jgi:hypothetical protein